MALIKSVCFSLLVVVPFMVVGCGMGGDPEFEIQKSELGSIYQIHRQYVKNNERPPTELAELKQYEPIQPMGMRVLREGKYQLVWGVDARDGGTILAYETDAKDKGGAVLMADGKVKKMSASQFQAAFKDKG